MASQGKCVPCGVVYEWYKNLVLTKSACPECGTQLKMTNIKSQLPRIYIALPPKEKKIVKRSM